MTKKKKKFFIFLFQKKSNYFLRHTDIQFFLQNRLKIVLKDLGILKNRVANYFYRSLISNPTTAKYVIQYNIC